MNYQMFKKILACFLAVLSVFNATPFTLNMVNVWLLGPGYTDALPAEKAEMLLDLYVNQDFIYLSEDAENLTYSVLSQMLIEVFSSEGDGEKIVEALEALPVYNRSERDTTREDYEPDTEENQKTKASLQKLIDNSGLSDSIKDGFKYFTNGINDVYVYFLYTKYEGVYEFAGDFVTDTGVVVADSTGVYYDSNSSLMYGVNNNGVLQIGFDFRANSITMQNPVNAWQRRFGFNIFYDIIGNMLLIDTDTVRVRFEYNGQKKMFQFWKGNYTRISNGAEIGLYNKRDDSLIHYDSVPDEEMLYMSLELYHGDEMVLRNDRELHWWLTGYQPGPAIDPSDLRLECEIEFTEQGMFDAFMEAAHDAFGKDAVISSDGMKAQISWQ